MFRLKNLIAFFLMEKRRVLREISPHYRDAIPTYVTIIGGFVLTV